jgi:chromatin structure-remodeling complex subunit SFH1
VWNLNEALIKPESFARIFCNDMDLPINPWAETIAAQIRAQLEEYQDVAAMELGMDGAIDFHEGGESAEELPECRVVLSVCPMQPFLSQFLRSLQHIYDSFVLIRMQIDVQIANHHLMDHIEWDLLSPLTPEHFARQLSAELGLTGEAVPLIAHAIHEELVKHKKDVIEWGVLGTSTDAQQQQQESTPAPGTGEPEKRDRSGYSLLKDKTGLGLGWGRAPRDGRGPKVLKSIWRDWAEAEEFATSFEVLTAEDIEKREIERERASRRLRRETSKFQSAATGRMRNLRYR